MTREVVAMHMWGLWGGIPLIVAGAVWGRIMTLGDRGYEYRGSWREVRDLFSLLVPYVAGATVVILSIYSYRR